MIIAIAGGTGFLGGALAAELQRLGHDLIILTRSRRPGQPHVPPASSGTPAASVSTERSRDGKGREVQWSPDGRLGDWAAAVDGADVVVNLAGESIAGGRWSEDRKRRIRDSRVMATRSLAAAIGRATTPPRLFVSGSAVGYYGDCGDELVSEARPPGNDFLADVCVGWEREAIGAQSARTRVVCIRTGLVLDRRGGALPAMLMPFRLGIGGRLGTGRQYMPWIHKHDWVRLVSFVIADPAAGGVSGAINATASSPVTNTEFTRTLARVLNRPAVIPAPAFALRLLLGQMADGLLLSGQRAVPEVATRVGFRFAHVDLEGALCDVLSR